MIDPGLANKVVLVTGADNPHGIGAAIAEAFAALGAAVFVTDAPQRAASAGAGVVAARLRAHGGRVASAAADLADPAAIPSLFDRVEATLGPVDILINNAAHSTSDSIAPLVPGAADWAGRAIATVDAKSHDRHFAVNSRAVALLMAEFARRHVARGATWGRVVTISTDAADAFPDEVSYGASKAALESYSRSAALELAKYGITVNIVAPGPIQTGWISPEMERPIVASVPLGRLGEPDDVADVVVFLASEQARWVTGQRLFVGGGHRV